MEEQGKKYVSASIQRLRKKVKANPDQAEAFKDNAKSTVEFGIADFEKRLRSGEVKITSVGDFEKLVKLGMLLHGEATDKIEHTTDVETVTTTQFDSIKNLDEFKFLTERLSEQMNKDNEDK